MLGREALGLIGDPSPHTIRSRILKAIITDFVCQNSSPSPHTIRSRILKVTEKRDRVEARQSFTAHDPFEDTERSPTGALQPSGPCLHRTRSVRGY